MPKNSPGPDVKLVASILLLCSASRQQLPLLLQSELLRSLAKRRKVSPGFVSTAAHARFTPSAITP